MNYERIADKISQFCDGLPHDNPVSIDILKHIYHPIVMTFQRPAKDFYTMRGFVAEAYAHILALTAEIKKTAVPKPPLFSRSGFSAAELVETHQLYQSPEQQAIRQSIQLCMAARKLLEDVLKEFGVDLKSESSGLRTPPRQEMEEDVAHTAISTVIEEAIPSHRVAPPSEGLSKVKQHADDVEKMAKEAETQLLPSIPVPALPPMSFFAPSSSTHAKTKQPLKSQHHRNATNSQAPAIPPVPFLIPGK